MLKIFAISIIAISLVSCSTVGVKKPDLATLQNQKVTDGKKSHSLMFEKLDGKKLTVSSFSRPNKSAHYIEPGKRKLQLKVTLTSDTTEVVWAAKIVIVAELKSNEIYKVRASEKNWCIKFELINSKGEIVGGPDYSKLFPYISYNHMKDKGLMARVNNKIKNASCT